MCLYDKDDAIYIQWNTDKRITLGTWILIHLTVLVKERKNGLGSRTFDPVHRLIHLSSDPLISILLYTVQ